MSARAERVNELARDICFYSDKCSKDCYAVNCETTWAAEILLARGWNKQDTATSDYTVEQYQKVLAKAADMKAAIDELQEMTKKGIYSWVEFGKALDAIYEARDAYYQIQLDIAAQTFNN